MPQYRYSLYDECDRYDYDLIKHLANKTKQIKLNCGDKGDAFLKCLLRTQRLDDWRGFLKKVVAALANGQIDLEKLAKQYLTYQKGLTKWVIFRKDKEICAFLDALNSNKI